MDVSPLPLAADFPPPGEADWVALVEKTLKGGSPETLVSRSYDGLPTRALYTAPDAPAGDPGPLAASRTPGAWDVRTIVDHPDPATANADALRDLENGASSLLLRIDPTGRDGVAVASAADLSRALEDIEIDLAPVALDAGFLGPQAGEWLHAVAKSAPRAKLALHLDPFGSFAVAGASPGPVEGHLTRCAELAARLAPTYPDATMFLASGAAVHEAGGGEAMELGFLLASAAVYARAMQDAGMSLEDALPLIAVGLSIDGEYFLSLAKLRAARAVWARFTASCGAPSPLRLEARASRRMLSRLDPWVNLLRLTAAGFAAGVGGAEAIVLEPFTQPLGDPATSRATPFARRQARNAQLVLMEESALARVADPAAGCWFLEAQTDQLARAGWATFQQVERRGGAVAALKSGFIAEEVVRVRTAREADLASGARKLIGVTVYRNPDAAPVAVETVDPAAFARPAPDIRTAGPDDACPPLPPWRASAAFEEAAATEEAS